MAETPLTVGSPQQVIDRTLGFRDMVGDYQRQLFLVDHAGLPLATVLKQLDMFGSEVLPVLSREFAAMRAPGVPEAPVHPRLRGQVGESAAATPGPVDDVTGASFYEQAASVDAAIDRADHLIAQARGDK